MDVEDAGSLGDLAETLRGVAHGEHPVLAVIEHEDEWFALVRVDGEEDPRVFVSDLPAASRGPFAELLSSAAEVETADRAPGASPARDDGSAARDSHVPADAVPEAVRPVQEADDEVELVPQDEEGGVAELDVLMDEADGDGVVPDVGDLDEPDPLPPPVWAGDPALLDDLGIDRRRLCALTEDNTDDPAAVLSEIGERAGFADLLEALR